MPIGGRVRFVWRCLKSTGKRTLPKSAADLNPVLQWCGKSRLNLTHGRHRAVLGRATASGEKGQNPVFSTRFIMLF